MWMNKFIKRLGRDERGGIAVPFALLAPMLVLLSLGTVEISTLMFEWHRTSEATRWAARHLAIEAPLANVSGFDRGTVITCQGSVDDLPVCSGAAIASNSSWSELVSAVTAKQPLLSAQNIKVIYQDSGLGNPSTPGGILPLVSVELVNVTKPLMVLGGYMGLPADFTFPPFRSYQIANSIGQTQ